MYFHLSRSATQATPRRAVQAGRRGLSPVGILSGRIIGEARVNNVAEHERGESNEGTDRGDLAERSERSWMAGPKTSMSVFSNQYVGRLTVAAIAGSGVRRRASCEGIGTAR